MTSYIGLVPIVPPSNSQSTSTNQYSATRKNQFPINFNVKADINWNEFDEVKEMNKNLIMKQVSLGNAFNFKNDMIVQLGSKILELLGKFQMI